MSNTPRTDALHFGYKDGINMQRHELLKLSRTLELELAEARKDADRWRKFLKNPFTAWDHIKIAGVAAERERCAKVCEERGSFNSMYAHHILTGAAEAIRKGEKESLTVEARKPVPEFELIEKWEGE
jgi:hypothetical protein